MDAVYRQRYQNGPPVPALLEYRALSEFGWTQDDYDRADHARLQRTLYAASLNQALARSDRGEQLSDAESELVGRVLAAHPESVVAGDIRAVVGEIRVDNGND